MSEAGCFNIVWRIPASMSGWRNRMEHLRDDLYYGSIDHPTYEAADERAKADAQKFQQQADDGDISAAPEFVRIENRSPAHDPH